MQTRQKTRILRSRRTPSKRFASTACGFVLACGIIAAANNAQAEDVIKVAVATNFAPVLKHIASLFHAEANVRIETRTGSSGKLYAQILNGMDIDIFLSADQARVDKLVAAEKTLPDTRMTYAEGRLVWWVPGTATALNKEQAIPKKINVEVVALAQPRLAPYGLAAQQTLMNCMNIDSDQTRLVYGENVGQAFAHVATGNAAAGLVALPNVMLMPNIQRSEYWVVPSQCHEPINQDAVALAGTSNASTAKEFLVFLRSRHIRQLIKTSGYAGP